MKRFSLKLLIYTFFFVIVIFLGLKSASAVDENQPNNYGYKSRRVVTEALAQHTEVPEGKRKAILDMLSKDGYFWFKTKQAKLNYIHKKLPTSRYLIIVADAENIHSWTVKPLTSKEVSYKMSVEEYGYIQEEVEALRSAYDKALIAKIVQHGEQGALKTRKVGNEEINYTVVNGVQFILKGWLANQALKVNKSVFDDIATQINVLHKAIAQGPVGEMPPTKIVITNFLPNPDSGGHEAEARGNDTILASSAFMAIYRVWPGRRLEVFNHEFGHLVDSSLSYQKEPFPGYNYNTMTANLTNAYDAFIKLRGGTNLGWFNDLFDQNAYAATAQNEFFAETFKTFIVDQNRTQIVNFLENPPSYMFWIKKEQINFGKFLFEYMATRLQGKDPKFHPFTHKPIMKIYSVDQILNGDFLK